jgi:hypothetical protein
MPKPAEPEPNGSKEPTGAHDSLGLSGVFWMFRRFTSAS